MTEAEPKTNPTVPRGLDLVLAVLGVDPDVFLRCDGNPEKCGTDCTEETCPLRNNRLQDLGSLVTALLEEFRWHRAWAEELEVLQVVPPGTLERVNLRVEKSRLQDRLREALSASETTAGVQVLRERIVSRIAAIRADIETIDTKLDNGGPTAGGAKA
jgi:hypothetical protein